jgi:hypothetical protein
MNDCWITKNTNFLSTWDNFSFDDKVKHLLRFVSLLTTVFFWYSKASGRRPEQLQAAHSVKQEALVAIKEEFGETLWEGVKNNEGRFMLSVSADRKELRGWNNLPFEICTDHVDSNGYDRVLFEMCGDSFVVEALLYQLLQITKFVELTLPNGSRLFVRMGP